MIGWQSADEGWCTLNSDGSLYSNNNCAAAGGFIRDHEGRQIVAFAANMSSCLIMRAELRWIIEGMNLAWEKGIKKLCIQTHSMVVVSLLNDTSNLHHRHASLMEQFTP
ncbi:Putative ribonuclease H protein At1g65750 [Linum perenne]